MFMDEVKRGELRGMIVRAADFYGPGAVLSLTHATVTQRLKAKKTPQWVGNPKAVHTFTYTPDAGRTVALLGNTATAYGQVWHALTSHDPMTGEQYVRIACELLGRPYGLQVPPRWMLSFLGVFVPVAAHQRSCQDACRYGGRERDELRLYDGNHMRLRKRPEPQVTTGTVICSWPGCGKPRAKGSRRCS